MNEKTEAECTQLEKGKLEQEVQELEDELIRAESLNLEFQKAIKYRKLNEGFCRTAVETKIKEGEECSALLKQKVRTAQASVPRK